MQQEPTWIGLQFQLARVKGRKLIRNALILTSDDLGRRLACGLGENQYCKWRVQQLTRAVWSKRDEMWKTKPLRKYNNEEYLKSEMMLEIKMPAD